MSVTPMQAARALVERFEADALRTDGERDRVREQVRAVATWLRGELGVARVYLVGSFAWGEPDAASDVDLVVDDVAEDRRGSIEAECARRIGRTVELLRMPELDEGFRARVLAEGEAL